jgi:hypothetical protein
MVVPDVGFTEIRYVRAEAERLAITIVETTAAEEDGTV